MTTGNEHERRYFDPIETAPRSTILAVQEKRLLAQVAYVAERSPIVRSVWGEAGIRATDIGSLADYQRLAPMIDKDRLRSFRDCEGDPFGGVVCVPSADVTLVGTSSGTTGDPTLFAERFTDAGCWIWTPREMWELGVRPGDYTAQVDSVLRSVGRLYYQDMGAVPILVDHEAGEIPYLIEMSLKYRPKTLFMLESMLIYALAQYEKEHPVDLRDVFSSYVSVVYGGEPLSKRSRDLIARWNIPLYQMTSLGDVGTAWECRAHDGFHVWEDLVLFEVVDPATGPRFPEGTRGELVVTSLCDRTDPLIRFRSGDLVRWTKDPCSCGRTHARFWIMGRAGDEVLVNGLSVLPVDVWEAIESVPETAAGLFQLIRPQREMTDLKLRVGYDGQPDLAATVGRVADAVATRVGVRPIIELVPDRELIKLGPYHKIPRTAKQ